MRLLSLIVAATALALLAGCTSTPAPHEAPFPARTVPEGPAPLGAQWYLRTDPGEQGAAGAWYSNDQSLANWLAIPTPTSLEGTPLRDEALTVWYRARTAAPHDRAATMLRVEGVAPDAVLWVNEERFPSRGGVILVPLANLRHRDVLLNIVLRTASDGTSTGLRGPVMFSTTTEIPTEAKVP